MEQVLSGPSAGPVNVPFEAAPLTYSALGDPVFGNDASFGQWMAFIGTTETGTTGVYASTFSSLQPLAPIAQVGDAAPDVNGANFASFTKLVLPDQVTSPVGAIFLASLGGSNGIWSSDAATMFVSSLSTHKVICEGDSLMVSGVAKTIQTLSVFAPSSETQGQSRNFNSTGNLIYLVTFTDGTQALQTVTFPGGTQPDQIIGFEASNQ
jgi:hypothetical protein